MEFNEIIKYLGEHLSIELSTSFDGCCNNQEIEAVLKIGEVEISRSSATVYIDDNT